MFKKRLLAVTASIILTTGVCYAAGGKTTSTAAETPTAESIQPIFTSNKHPLVVEQNKTFTITLQSNETTGFSWKVAQYDKPLVTLVGHQYVAPNNRKLVGAPGYEVWEFKANAGNYSVVQVGHIVMEYARPWEKTPGTKKIFIVQIK